MKVHPFKTRPNIEHAPWGSADWPFLLDDDSTAVAAIHLIDGDTICADSNQPIAERTNAWGPDLLGRAAPMGRIPYTIRWLGTAQLAPIHVTTTADDAHKAWYIVEAKPDARIYRGLRPGSAGEDLLNAPTEDDARDVLQSIDIKRGQCYYIAPGVPHAMGPGVVLAEVQTATSRNIALTHNGVQQPSNDPVAADRPDIAAFEKRTHVTSLFTTVTRLITTPSFYIERVRFMGELEQDIPYAELVCWLVLEGTGAVLHGKKQSLTFAPGDCVILPAALSEPRLRTDTDCVWLEITIPVESDLAAFPRPDAEYLRANEGTTNHPIPLNISIKKENP